MSKALPYCDTTKTHADRVADVIGRLSLDEKIAMCVARMLLLTVSY